MPKDINELRKHYATLPFPQKKDFIMNLKNKLEKTPSQPHQKLLEECIRAYNAEVRQKNTAAGFDTTPKMPDISPDTFARALATLITGGMGNVPNSRIRDRLVGRWQRDPDEGIQYYTFNNDGSFETNEYEGSPSNADTLAFPSSVLVGNFTVSPDNDILMEPHDKLKFTSLMFSQTADSLIIAMKDGLTFEYKKVGN
jgi:hypothetical protein